jgi:hypothetical protein
MVGVLGFELSGLKRELFFSGPETFAPNGLDNLNTQSPETSENQKSPQIAGFFAKKAELSLFGRQRCWACRIRVARWQMADGRWQILRGSEQRPQALDFFLKFSIGRN